MMTIKSAAKATPIMEVVLPRSITPLDIARRAECSVMSVMSIKRPDLMIGDSVSEIANLADASKTFQQSDAASRGVAASAAAFGRETLDFDADRERHYTLSAAVDYTGAFSLAAVFRPQNLGARCNLLGDETTVENDRAGFQLQPNGALSATVAGLRVDSSVLTNDTWYAALMSYDGSANITLEVIGSATLTATGSPSPAGTSLRLGDDNSAFGFVGQIDMAAMFATDLHGSTNAGLLADVKLMLSQFYRSAVQGV